MSDGPHLLIANETDLQDVVLRTRKVIPIERHRRPPLGPQFVHGEEVGDVVVEQLVEDQLRVVAGIDGPLTGGDANDVSVVEL